MTTLSTAAIGSGVQDTLPSLQNLDRTAGQNADRDGPDRLEHDLREAGSGSGEVQHAIIADEMNGAAVGTKVPHDGRERIAV